jgi:tetratricopeptide (TPR) repeat protein
MIYVVNVRYAWSGIASALILLRLSVTVIAQNTADAAQDIAALERKVQKHLQEQQPQLAIPVLAEIVRLDSGNVNAQANLGVLLYFQNKFDHAIPHLEAAAKAQPELWRIHALLGMAQKRIGKSGQAREHLEVAFDGLTEEKIKVQVGLELIELYSGAAQFEKALAIAVKLTQLAPREPQVLLATYQLARQTMDQALLNLLVAAPESAQMHIVMANEMARKGDHIGAVNHYRQALKLNPSLPGAHLLLAEQLRASPDPRMNAQAEAEYRTAIAVNPYDQLARRQLGAVLSAKGDYPAAEENFRQALTLQANDAEAKTGLAIVLISTNRNAEAVPLLESAIQDDPTNMTAHFRLGGLYRRAGRVGEADRETQAFRHYQDLKDKLARMHGQLSAPQAGK